MDPTTELVSATFLAACHGDAHAVAALLDVRAAVGRPGGGMDARCAERDGATLLIVAADEGQEAIVRMLLARGAGVNLQSSLGCTALMAATGQGHTTIVQALLDAKADASLQAIDGSTALMLAEQEKHTATAQLLRQHAQGQAAEAKEAVMHPAVSAPTPHLSGRRVRIAGLKGRPQLNGRSGVAGRFDAAKGRYEVAVVGEAEAVLLKPANMQETIELAGCSPYTIRDPCLNLNTGTEPDTNPADPKPILESCPRL